MATSSDSQSKAGFHEGNMFLVAARLYRGLQLTLLEGLQNGMDACLPETGFAILQPRVVVCVNQQTREAFVLDNGAGVDRERFDTCIGMLGMSQKGNEALGRFGVGIASPTTECEKYYFTSWARTDNKVRQWTFCEADIAQQEELYIPLRTLKALPAVPEWLREHLTGEFSTDWHTIVHLRNLKRDRLSSAFDAHDFLVETQTRFSIAMRKQGVLVRVVHIDRKGKPTIYDIDPLEFTGEPLDVVGYESKLTGAVEIELKLAPEHGDQAHGIVVVMRTGDNTAVSINNFSRQALAPNNKPSASLRSAMRALRSGRFAGEIRCEHIVLDLERERFKTDTGVFAKLCELLAKWYDEVGWFYFELGHEEAAARRWQAVAAESQKWLGELLSQPQHTVLLDTVGPLLSGSDSAEGGIALRPRRQPADEAGGGGTKKDATKAEPTPAPKDGDKEQPEGDKEDETAAPRPSSRRERRLPLQIEVAPLRTPRLWLFDFPSEGHPAILRINSGHPEWDKLDGDTERHKRWLRELTDWLWQHVLVLLASFPEPAAFEEHRAIVDQLVGMFTDGILKRDVIKRKTSDSSDDDEDAQAETD